VDTRVIHEAARARGIVPEALDTVTATVQAHFGENNPKPADLDAYLLALPTWDKLGMTREAFDRMPVEWRLTQGRSFQPRVQRQRPYRPAAPPEVQRQWKDLPLTEQMARYRAWCDEQPRP